MTFKNYIKQNIQEDTNKQEFIENVTKSFKKHFPNGFISLSDKSQFGSDLISGTFGMIGNLKDNTSGIPGNDKMKHSFMMFKNPGTEPETYKFEGQGRIYTNPEKGSFNAMDSIKTKLGNNSKITLEKAQIKLEKFFKKLSGLMKDNKDNIFGVEDIDKKYLVFK